MNRLLIDDFKSETLEISLRDAGDTICVDFHGSLDMQDTNEALDPYFDSIHERVVEMGLKKINCNFRMLKYINSSGIKSLLKWILRNNRETSRKKRYAFIFSLDENSQWQVDGIGFLKKIAPDLIIINGK